MGVVTSLAHYILYGFHPGSFGYALLIQDVELSYKTAHALLKAENNYKREDIVKNMLSLVASHVPDVAKGSRATVDAWLNHGGIKNTSDLDLSMRVVEMKLKGQTPWWEQHSHNSD